MFVELDGTRYSLVFHREMRRNYHFIEGENSGESVDHNKIFDTVGVTYTFELEVDPDPRNPDAYDAFFEQCSRPKRRHQVKLPFGTVGDISFEGYIEDGGDMLYGDIDGSTGGYNQRINRFHGHRVRFVPCGPIRLCEDEIAISIKAENDTAVEGDDIQWNVTFSGTNIQLWNGGYDFTLYKNGEVVLEEHHSTSVPSGVTSLTEQETLSVGVAGRYWCVISTTPSLAIGNVTSREVSPVIRVSEASV